MPQRKDHLMIVTDAGVTLHLGADYGIPYNLDPLNGVDVALKLAQGVNQIGQTVGGQTVAGVYRELTADCSSEHGDADALLLLQSLPYFTTGTLYFMDKYFCRFVLSKTPYTTQIHGFPRLNIMLFCPRPYWYDLTAVTYVLGGFVPSFRLPVNYATPHRFGVRTNIGWLNARNPGALAVPFTAVLTCDAEVVNPRVVNVITGAQIGLQATLSPGDVVEIYRTTTDKLALKRTRSGVTESVFALLDEASDLTELAAGDNMLATQADTGADNLQVTISFYPMRTGILPEVIP